MNEFCERWQLPLESFRAAVDASIAHAFRDRTPSAADLERYVSSLHLEDLALACACAAGNEAAWEHFVREYRPALYQAAAAIGPGGNAREAADSIYADLFGVDERLGERRSLFRYFHGRSSLMTWLRAILAQRHVDRLRASRRIEPLSDEGEMPAPQPSGLPEGERTRFVRIMHETLAAAIAALPPRDRLRLSFYYARDMTLAAIGGLLREHEATVSRHLSRTRRAVRADVERRLGVEHGLDAAAIDECFAAVIDDPGALDVGQLLGQPAACKNDAPDRSEF